MMQQYKIRELVNTGEKIINPSFVITKQDQKRAKEVITDWHALQKHVFRCHSINRLYWALALYRENQKMLEVIYS